MLLTWAVVPRLSRAGRSLRPSVLMRRPRAAQLRGKARGASAAAGGTGQRRAALKRYRRIAAAAFHGPSWNELGELVMTTWTASGGGTRDCGGAGRAFRGKSESHGISPVVIHCAEPSAAGIPVDAPRCLQPETAPPGPHMVCAGLHSWLRHVRRLAGLRGRPGPP
jgi:hypothetical protein